MKKFDVGIVGGGISGLVAGIFARRNGSKVTIFESNSTLGKKILKTGGGRCNFANEDNSISHYHSYSKDSAKAVFSLFSKDQILNFCNEIGILPKSIDGWYYPNSMQARSVRDCLCMELDALGCDVFLETKVNNIKSEGESILVSTNKGIYSFDKLILACGGKALPDSGSDGNGFVLAQNTGHTINTPLPALCPIVCDDRFLKIASGIRIDAEIKLTIDGKKFLEKGNLQITDFGISGICVMQLSFLVSKALLNNSEIQCEIDFLPDIKKSEAKNILLDRFLEHGVGKSAKSAMIGLIPDKLITPILSKSGIKSETNAKSITKPQLDIILGTLKAYSIKIVDVKGFLQSQTTFGGVSFESVDKKTLISKLNKNIGFCGEILDVCGDCGGYNISWAIASGAVVGQSIVGGK